MLDGFVVQIEFESKNGSIVGQFVDCITRLVGMELKHKPWNRSEEFKRFCIQQGVSYEMFLYKDERFGCFPKACAVCIFSKEILKDFLTIKGALFFNQGYIKFYYHNILPKKVQSPI